MDWLTVVPDGEPTLDITLGETIERLRQRAPLRCGGAAARAGLSPEEGSVMRSVSPR